MGALGALGVIWAASRNIAPDAVSRASTWNEHEGQAEWLTDGIVPPEDASAFVWFSKGILVFEWDTVQHVEQVRVRLGTADSDFEARTYIGGQLLEDGSTRNPQGECTATVQDMSGVADGWLVLDFPAGTRADNLEFHTRGAAELYEVEILVAENQTLVQNAGWARVKAMQGRGMR